MARKILSLLLALALAVLPALAEGEGEGVEPIPGEVGEFDLASPEPTAEATPEPTAAQTPLPTLEPGSVNYPADKVNFEGEIWSILTRRWGLKDFQAAGLMSSLYAESTFCPYNAEGKDGVDNRGNYRFRTGDGVGFGLCQWTSPGRKAALSRYAVQRGDANLVWDFDIQMGYMQSEIDMGALKATETLYEATEWAVLRYERPNQAYPNSWPGRRYVVALQIFKAHTGKAWEEPPLEFGVRTSDGADALGGFAFSDEAEITVTSNYYWRLSRRPLWLEAQCPNYYDARTWETCACGYGGTTTVRLHFAVPPILPGHVLRFEIWRGNGERVDVPFTYEGPGFIERARDMARSWRWLARLLSSALTRTA